MEETARKFRDKMGRFMAKRERNKKYYKIGKKYNFYMYELVMKTEYVTESALHPTHSDPHRIIGLSEKGAEIKNIKTGEISNVNFENLRKITLDELLVLLPQNFDNEISKALGTFRYNRKDGDIEEENLEEDKEKSLRRLRSGTCYQVSLKNTPEKIGNVGKTGIWRRILIKKSPQKDATRLKVQLGF
jgi:hypothetical protein